MQEKGDAQSQTPGSLGKVGPSEDTQRLNCVFSVLLCEVVDVSLRSGHFCSSGFLSRSNSSPSKAAKFSVYLPPSVCHDVWTRLQMTPRSGWIFVSVG